MKIQHYCYTRAKFLDYCVFSEPDNLPKYASKEIQAKALSIMDALDSKLNIPKWILVKTHDYIFWGMCCLNRILSEECNSDYSGTSVSGMFAIVITEYSENEVQLPFAIEYFRKLYEQEVAMFWNQNEAHKNTTNGFISGDFNFIQASHGNYCESLNTDMFKCKSLGNLDKKEVVAAALSLDNVSLLIDNDNIEQATNRSGSFMNCLTSYVGIGLYSVKQQCPKCKKYVSSFTEAGICEDCKKSEEAEIRRRASEEDKKDKQIRYELEEAKSRIEILESEVESSRCQINSKNRLIKILWIICGILLLLCMWLYKHSDIEISSVFSENRLSSFQKNVSKEKTSSYFIKVNSEKVEISPAGDENLTVEWKTNCKKVNANLSDVDWANIEKMTGDSVVICVKRNDSKNQRIAILTISSPECGEKQVELYQKQIL